MDINVNKNKFYLHTIKKRN